MEVDYLKLSEQYANFLVAIGGVSITVLALVLSSNPHKTNAFLVASLVVATIACFTGAHMMAETAAFINTFEVKRPGVSGERLFLLASINIFVAVILVIFALMFLPIALNKVDDKSFKPISFFVFVFIIIAVLVWMGFASNRIPIPPQGIFFIAIPALINFHVWRTIFFFLIFKKISEEIVLYSTFIPIIFFTLVSLIRFVLTFKNSDMVNSCDIALFSFVITFACASLSVAALMELKFNKEMSKLGD